MAATVGKWREVGSSRMVPEKENLMKWEQTLRVFQGKKERTDTLTQGSQTVFQENTMSWGM